MEPDRPMTVDEACKKYAGSYGFWQWRTFFVVGLVKIPSAWQMASILFIAYGPQDFWCTKPPEYANLTVEEWKSLSHSVLMLKNGQTVYNPCRIHQLNESEESSCPHFSFLASERTIITQWNLVCDRSILTSVSQFFYLFGILIGGVLAYFIIPRFGPRRVLLTAGIVQVLAGVAVAYSSFLELKIFMRWLIACACCNMFSAGYVICADVVNSRTPRLVLCCCYEHFWSIGVITLAISAYYVPDWQHLQLVLSLPTILILMLYRWVPESPKWLFTKGKFEEVIQVLSVAAQLNGLPQPPMDLEKLVIKRSADTIATWTQMLRESGVTKVAAVHILWACTIVTYYGGLLNVKNLGDHVYMNTMVAGVAEVVGVLIGLTILLHCGEGPPAPRWLILGGLQVAGGVACLMCWFLPQDQSWEGEVGMLSCGMAGRLAIATSLTLLSVAAGELWLPNIRPIATFSCVTFARVFLLTAPFIGVTAQYGRNVSLSFFGSITILGGMAAIVAAVVDKNQP